MRRWLKRIVLTAAALSAVLVCVAAVVAWRATRVPTWYATAVDQTPPDEQADAAINDRLSPLQNWLARTASGDVDAKPDSEKIYTLELTETEINALLAKGFDHLHDQFQIFRTRLTPGRIDLAFTWAEQGRTVGIETDVDQPAEGYPTIALGGVRLGDQGVPTAFVVGEPAAQVRAALEERRRRGKTPRIDEQGVAPSHTVEAYYGRLLLDILAGRAVSPLAFLPEKLVGGEWRATRVTRLDVTDGKLAITFRLLTAEERAAVVAGLSGPLPGS